MAGVRRTQRARQQLDAAGPAPASSSAQRSLVLPGEQVRRGQERSLAPRARRRGERPRGDRRLARADVALQQAQHRRGRGHVRPDRSNGRRLVVGERDRPPGLRGQARHHRLPNRAVAPVVDLDGPAAGQAAAAPSADHARSGARGARRTRGDRGPRRGPRTMSESGPPPGPRRCPAARLHRATAAGRYSGYRRPAASRAARIVRRSVIRRDPGRQPIDRHDPRPHAATPRRRHAGTRGCRGSSGGRSA